MVNGRAILESSTEEGVFDLLDMIREEFPHVSFTLPIKCADGQYLSSVIYSNDRTIMEVNPECGLLQR